MGTHLRSHNVFLLFDDVFRNYPVVHELWQEFRRTAVEPSQSSSPELASFVDECLLFAHIVTNTSPTQEKNDYDDVSLWDLEEGTQYPPSSHTPPTTTLSPSPEGETVGLVYLHAGLSNLPGGEANIGIIVKPEIRCHGFARYALQLALRWAFEEFKFHRVQAAVLDTPFKDRVLSLFIGSGFAHEGTKRRAIYQPEGDGMAGMWKDVTYLAMLDTEWAVKIAWMRDNHASQLPIASVWDEMFARHAREREELVRWEEKHGRMKRTPSTETLRDRARNAEQDIAYLTDDASSFSSSLPPSPRPQVLVTLDGGADMADDFGLAGSQPRMEDEFEINLTARQHRRWMGSASLDPSPQGHMLALPSIPSIRLSEGNLQSPLTIPSPSATGSSSPPFSPSPSPAPSSVHSTWSDSEDEDNWLPREDPSTTPPDAHPPTGHASTRTRSRGSSVSSSSSDDWSDAQSSVGANSWDVVSDVSDTKSP